MKIANYSFFKKGLLALGLGSIIALPGLPLAAPYVIDEIPIPIKRAGPTLITYDQDGSALIPLAKANKLLRLAHNKREMFIYSVPDLNWPVGVHVEKDGAIHVTSVNNNKIIHFNSNTGQSISRTIDRANAWPFMLQADEQGNLWWTERFSNRVVRDMGGKEHVLMLTNPASGPAGLIVDKKFRRVAFTMNTALSVGIVEYDETSERLYEYSIPAALKDSVFYGPAGIDVDSQGRFWFAVLDGYIGMINGSLSHDERVIRLFEYPDKQARPAGIKVQSTDRIWVTELDGNRIAEFNPETGEFSRYPLPTGRPDPEPRTFPEVVDNTIPKDIAPSTLPQTSRPFSINYFSGDYSAGIMFTEQYRSNLGILYRGRKSIHAYINEHVRIDPPIEFLAQRQYIQYYVAAHIKDSLVFDRSEITNSSPSILTKGNIFGLQRVCDSEHCTLTFVRSGNYKFTVVSSETQKPVSISVAVRHKRIPAEVISLSHAGQDIVPGVLKVHGRQLHIVDIGGFELPLIGSKPPGDGVIRLDLASHQYDYHTAPTSGSAPTSLDIDERGGTWFTQRLTDSIAYAAPDGTITEYSIGRENSRPTGIAYDRKRKSVWYTMRNTSEIGQLDIATGTHKFISTPSENSEPSTIAVDEENKVWFDERGTGNVIHLNPDTSKMDIFNVGGKESRIIGITPHTEVLPSGEKKIHAWYLELVGNKIGRIDPVSGNVVSFSIPSQQAFPFKLAILDGKQLGKPLIAFTEVMGDRIGILNTANDRFMEFKTPFEQSMPGGISVTENNDLVFSMHARSAIGIVPNTIFKLISK